MYERIYIRIVISCIKLTRILTTDTRAFVFMELRLAYGNNK